MLSIRSTVAANAFAAIAAMAADCAPQTLIPDQNLNVQIDPEINLSTPKEAAIQQMQRPVQITVPYRVSNLPPGITRARIQCSIEVQLSGGQLNIRGDPNLTQNISLSGGSASGFVTLSGIVPPDRMLEPRTTAELQSVTNVEVPQYRCGPVCDGPDYNNWLWGAGFCRNSNLCEGATRNLESAGNFQAG